MKKRDLRACAWAALEKREFVVKLKKGAGILPGSRLMISKGTEQRSVAVRTSLDREISLSRYPDGRWMTIPQVDEVVIAIPSVKDPTSADVFGFDSAVLLRSFDAALAARQKEKPDLSYKAQVYISLDGEGKSKSSVPGGLRDKAAWHLTISGVEASAHARVSSKASFVDRVKEEFAELNGVDVSKVSVEFRIIA